MIYLETPLTVDKIKQLKAGDEVFLSGTIYTGRDAAHKRLIQLLDEGKELPIDIKDCTIYYMGPSPAREGRPIGSAQHLQNQVKYLAVVDQPLQEEWMLIHLDLLNLAYMR